MENKLTLKQVAVAFMALVLSIGRLASAGGEVVDITLVKPVASPGGSGTQVRCEGDVCKIISVEKGAVVASRNIPKPELDKALGRFFSQLSPREARVEVPRQAILLWKIVAGGQSAEGGVAVDSILHARPDTEKALKAVRYLEREIAGLVK